jgi:iron(III) transport system substrate-binding protein
MAVAAGEVDVALVNHYYLYPLLVQHGENFAARNYHPQEGPGALVMISGAGLLSTAGNRDNAERFIAFLLETNAQEYFAGETYEYTQMYPGMAKTARDEGFAELAEWPDEDRAVLAEYQRAAQSWRGMG